MSVVSSCNQSSKDLALGSDPNTGNGTNAEDELVDIFVAYFMEIIAKEYDKNPAPLDHSSSFSSREALIEDHFKFSGEEMSEILSDLYESRSSLLGRSFTAGLNNQQEYGQYSAEEEPEIVPGSANKLDSGEVRLTFDGGAWYQGHLSGGIMEGNGTFFWADGGKYKGEFHNGLPTRSGRMEFPNQDCYEGGLFKNFRHGYGLYCFYDSPVMYSGEWWMGKKQGTGLMVYESPTTSLPDYYHGEWEQGMKQGYGVRRYKSGSVYMGEWCRGFRHGKGKMIWPNNDVYVGEWKNGEMEGQGEYVWDTRRTCSFTQPACNRFNGVWERSVRQGKGVLTLDNGTVIETTWYNGRKDGGGRVICPNGEIIVSDNLFSNDKLIRGAKLRGGKGSVSKTRSKTGHEHGSKLAQDGGSRDQKRISNNLNESSVGKPKKIAIVKPDYTIDLLVHVQRLMELKKKLKLVAELHLERDCLQEEAFLRVILQNYMMNVKDIYWMYAALTSKHGNQEKCVLLRLFFWQFLRDYHLHEKGHSLVEIEEALVAEPYLLLKNPRDPFEKLQIWQFFHIIIKLSWMFYGEELVARIKQDFDEGNCRPYDPILYQAVKMLLQRDLLPARSWHNGSALFKYKNSVSLPSIYMIYEKMGEITSRDFLYKFCNRKNNVRDIRRTGITSVDLLGTKIEEKNDGRVDGENVFDVEDFPKFKINKSLNGSSQYYKHSEDSLVELLVEKLSNLGPRTIIKSLCEVCHGLKQDGLIVDMDYKMTFLEFLETILLLLEKKISMQQQRQLKKEGEELPQDQI